MNTDAVLILGATGGIGRGVVAAAVQAGRPVIAVARNAAALLRLREIHPGADIVVLPASVGSDAGAAEMARSLDRPFGAVVAAICGQAPRGRVLEQPAEFLRRRIDEDLLPHLFAARHLLPLLAARGHGHYVLVGGPGAEQPWAGYGHRSIGAAALRMMARVLHDEARALPVRVQLLAVDSPACTEANKQHAAPQWPSALAIGQQALALASDPPAGAPVPAVAPHAIVPYAVVPHTSALSRTQQQGRALLRSLTLPLPHQESSH
jgi:NAD(P)-dependent dehydrogenase (short-subunit alcohol dehydrogenase family)